MALNAPGGGAPVADIWQQILSIMQGAGGNQPYAQPDMNVSPGVGGGSPPPGVLAGATGGQGGGGGGGGGGGSGGGGQGGGGVYAPFGEPAGGSDSPPAWLAKAALAAYQSGNTAYFNHLLADPTIQGNPHLLNFIKGLMAGSPDRIAEAQHYSTNPSYNGWNDAAGDGIPGDGK